MKQDPTYEINFAENLEFMSTLESESIDFIYIDPPFNTSKVQKKTKKVISKEWAKYVVDLEFYDSFGSGTSGYIEFMKPRLEHCHRLLKNTGVLCVHLDYNSVHYIKCKLDEIFGYGDIDVGKKHFINEIIWCYGGRGMAKRHYNRKHDIILVYSKTHKYTFNPYTRPVDQKSVHRYNKVDKNGNRYARVKNRDGSYSDIYLKEKVILEDYWHIPFCRGKEYLNYPTQKPVKLVSRLIKTFTKKSDLVADFFCGCATTLEASMSLDRSFIGCDGQNKVLNVLKERKIKRKEEMSKYPIKAKDPYSKIPKDFDKMAWQDYERKSILYAGGIPNAVQFSDGGWDGIRISDGALIQAKKHKSKTGRPDLQRFVGAMVLRKKKKGVFISHSGYTAQARNFVSDIRNDGYTIELKTSAYLQSEAELREKEIKNFNRKNKDNDIQIFNKNKKQTA